jgi:hypothetical protein
MCSLLKASISLKEVLNPKLVLLVGLIAIHGKPMNNIPTSDCQSCRYNQRQKEGKVHNSPFPFTVAIARASELMRF